MAPIKVGIVGYGFSTKCFHLPYILPNPDLEVYAFLQRAAPPSEDPNVQLKMGHCTVDFPKAKHYRTAEDFFADPEIDLVVVCTHEHEQFAEGALKAGKHVVVEKPFLKTSAKADELIQLAKEKNKILTVFQNRRFDSDFRTLEKLISLNALGDIKDAVIHYDFRDPGWLHFWNRKEYAPGDGMAFGLGTHTLDQALALFGRPASVTGFFRAARGVDSDIDDTFTIFLQYDGAQKDLTVTVRTAIITPLKEQLKYFIRGTEGSYIKYGYDPQEARAIKALGQPATDPDFGKEDPSIWGTLSTKREIDANSQKYDEESKLYIGQYPSLDGSYRAYYENVVDAINGKCEPRIKPELARDGLRIIELARESHEQGRTVAWH
ncbi:hypothetical protein jhhlp_000961 [Lomentospora prolificans]|uniref:Gfo/Idh/MocA-like oxidoreductase N-terminal domain-containing protein n=1 Tax=Lomentospora prolificans TaxID=41688 RepID=A0A2N3NK12_9PEZI|nr:hypothetical protein jhhlp_000961 [Lomentospora prolificans]